LNNPYSVKIYEINPKDILKFRDIGECQVCQGNFDDRKIYCVYNNEFIVNSQYVYVCSEECINMYILQNI
jgi:hypothetical protein